MASILHMYPLCSFTFINSELLTFFRMSAGAIDMLVEQIVRISSLHLHSLQTEAQAEVMPRQSEEGKHFPDVQSFMR